MPVRDARGTDDLFVVEDDRPRDWWLRDDEEEERCSRLGLDDAASIFERVGLTLTALAIGLIVLVTALVIPHVAAGWPLPLRILCRIAADAMLLFCAMVLVYVWWRPAWFRT